jgi:hypothetical protein
MFSQIEAMIPGLVQDADATAFQRLGKSPQPQLRLLRKNGRGHGHTRNWSSRNNEGLAEARPSGFQAIYVYAFKPGE